MTSTKQTAKGSKVSIKYPRTLFHANSFESNDICLKQNDESRTESNRKSEIRSSGDSISTTKFVSILGNLWDCVGQPAVFQSREGLKYNDNFVKENLIFSSESQRGNKTTSLVNTKSEDHDLKSNNCSSHAAKSDFEHLKTIKRMMLFASCTINNPLLSNVAHINDSALYAAPLAIDKAPSTKVADDKIQAHGGITWKPIPDLNCPVKHSEFGCISITAEGSSLGKEIHIAGVPDPAIAESNIEVKSVLSSGETVINEAENVQESHRSHDSFAQVISSKEAVVILSSPSSGTNLDHIGECLAATIGTVGESQEVTDSCFTVVDSSSEYFSTKDQKLDGSSKKLFDNVDIMQKYSSNLLLIQDKLQHAFDKNKNALAGALAGTLVSLCLHPVDTVKTIIQSNGAAEKSCHEIVRTIISEKGVMGLYRGIASNIASSAPISAVYTFTYESVKSALLPLLPKEYHSFAHCTAGACSSIATSFIFTPSEQIKQQMQVGLQYQNCWNALIGCLEKGGFSSLYAGWGAVLCRNIPHSIIKFYTYESMKQWMLKSGEPDSNLSTWQTLVCGGVAGSTAALFTTPFDVVKTRLQTQAPGSLAQYEGVLHALCEIARQEGMQGLYRGLTPRLAMYVSQGAIFFASYEFLKALFSLEARRNTSPVREIRNIQDDNSELQSTQKLPA
ncbi:Mitochondrial carrier protein PET8 protein [Dioscorea alata]|uniref:Mitochondrial carrier protein PET8 protein n=1 Tax=Dioscorea alata TaxID=55571 RepID=A0ACB7WRJ9_DIOAL|nr:Mitochondrial carrier protein PET8 protein [Dioscorea alata]